MENVIKLEDRRPVDKDARDKRARQEPEARLYPWREQWKKIEHELDKVKPKRGKHHVVPANNEGWRQDLAQISVNLFNLLDRFKDRAPPTSVAKKIAGEDARSAIFFNHWLDPKKRDDAAAISKLVRRLDRREQAVRKLAGLIGEKETEKLLVELYKGTSFATDAEPLARKTVDERARWQRLADTINEFARHLAKKHDLANYFRLIREHGLEEAWDDPNEVGPRWHQRWCPEIGEKSVWPRILLLETAAVEEPSKMLGIGCRIDRSRVIRQRHLEKSVDADVSGEGANPFPGLLLGAELIRVLEDLAAGQPRPDDLAWRCNPLAVRRIYLALGPTADGSVAAHLVETCEVKMGLGQGPWSQEIEERPILNLGERVTRPPTAWGPLNFDDQPSPDGHPLFGNHGRGLPLTRGVEPRTEAAKDLRCDEIVRTLPGVITDWDFPLGNFISSTGVVVRAGDERLVLLFVADPSLSYESLGGLLGEPFGTKQPRPVAVESCFEILGEQCPFLPSHMVDVTDVSIREHDENSSIVISIVGDENDLQDLYPTEFHPQSLAAFFEQNHLYAPDERKWFRLLELDIERRKAALGRYIDKNAERIKLEMERVRAAYLSGADKDATSP